MSIKQNLLGVTIAMVASSVMLAFTVGPDHSHDHGSTPVVDAKTGHGHSKGLAIANAYIDGMEAGDLDALSGLFLADERSTILENASNEGSWEYYRDHHLAPEMEVVENFRFEIAEESERAFGGTILVEQVGAFTVEINDETHDYRVAVSYLMAVEDGRLRIAHLHWSSRPKR